MIWMTAMPTLALFGLGLASVTTDGRGLIQYFATTLMGSGLLYYAAQQTLIRSKIAARQLLKATILYLPLQFLVLLLRKG